MSLPPFGYVLTVSGEPLDDRPVDISWFTTCGYDEKRAVDLPHLPVLPTQPFPGDYRSKDEIRHDFIINTLEGDGHPHPEEEARRIIESGEGPTFMEAQGEEW